MYHTAELMQRASGNIDQSLFQFQRFMEEWMQRFELAIEKLQPPKVG